MSSLCQTTLFSSSKWSFGNSLHPFAIHVWNGATPPRTSAAQQEPWFRSPMKCSFPLPLTNLSVKIVCPMDTCRNRFSLDGHTPALCAQALAACVLGRLVRSLLDIDAGKANLGCALAFHPHSLQEAAGPSPVAHQNTTPSHEASCGPPRRKPRLVRSLYCLTV